VRQHAQLIDHATILRKEWASLRWFALAIASDNVALNATQAQTMPNRPLADDGLALDDVRDEIYFVVGEHHANTFTYGHGISADGDQLSAADRVH
jgi:hypothetical protein